MVQCFAPDCKHPRKHRSESDTYRFLVALAGKKAGEYKVDSSIEVSKDFVVIYFFKLKNAVRPKVRYVCTIYCWMAVAMLLALHVFLTFKSVFLSVLFGYYCFSYFHFKSLLYCYPNHPCYPFNLLTSWHQSLLRIRTNCLPHHRQLINWGLAGHWGHWTGHWERVVQYCQIESIGKWVITILLPNNNNLYLLPLAIRITVILQ